MADEKKLGTKMISEGDKKLLELIKKYSESKIKSGDYIPPVPREARLKGLLAEAAGKKIGKKVAGLAIPAFLSGGLSMAAQAAAEGFDAEDVGVPVSGQIIGENRLSQMSDEQLNKLQDYVSNIKGQNFAEGGTPDFLSPEETDALYRQMELDRQKTLDQLQKESQRRMEESTAQFKKAKEAAAKSGRSTLAELESLRGKTPEKKVVREAAEEAAEKAAKETTEKLTKKITEKPAKKVAKEAAKKATESVVDETAELIKKYKDIPQQSVLGKGKNLQALQNLSDDIIKKSVEAKYGPIPTDKVDDVVKAVKKQLGSASGSGFDELNDLFAGLGKQTAKSGAKQGLKTAAKGLAKTAGLGILGEIIAPTYAGDAYADTEQISENKYAGLGEEDLIRLAGAKEKVLGLGNPDAAVRSPMFEDQKRRLQLMQAFDERVKQMPEAIAQYYKEDIPSSKAPKQAIPRAMEQIVDNQKLSAPEKVAIDKTQEIVERPNVPKKPEVPEPPAPEPKVDRVRELLARMEEIRQKPAELQTTNDAVESAKTTDKWMTFLNNLEKSFSHFSAANPWVKSKAIESGITLDTDKEEIMRKRQQAERKIAQAKMDDDINNIYKEAMIELQKGNQEIALKKMKSAEKIAQAKAEKDSKEEQTKVDREKRLARQGLITSANKLYAQDPSFKKNREQLNAFKKVEKSLDSAAKGNQASLAALGTQLARAMGEVGVLTDTDVVRYIGGTSWGRKLKDWHSKGMKGQLSKETLDDLKQNIKNISTIMNKEVDQNLNDVYSRMRTIYPEADDKVIKAVTGLKSEPIKQMKEPTQDQVTKYAKMHSLSEDQARKILIKRLNP